MLISETKAVAYDCVVIVIHLISRTSLFALVM